MTALIIIGCILLFFVFLLSLRATVTVSYGEELGLSVKVLFLRIRILPKKEKKKGPRSMSAKKAAKLRKKRSDKQEKKAAAAKQKKQEKEAKEAFTS